MKLDYSKIYVSFNYEKTGIPSFSLLAGNQNWLYNGYMTKEAKQAVNDYQIKGTCPATCTGCYALKMTRYPAVFKHLAYNTLLVKESPEKALQALHDKYFSNPYKAPNIFRIHDSGEFFSLWYFYCWIDFIKEHPNTIFGSYTKQKTFVNLYLRKEKLPDNLTLSCSPWKGFCEPIANLPQFCYDNGTDPTLLSIPHCPAVNKDGKRTGVQCINCLHCYKANYGEKWAVYSH